jgi:two-component system nitrogen regulation response regulator GlnG
MAPAQTIEAKDLPPELQSISTPPAAPVAVTAQAVVESSTEASPELPVLSGSAALAIAPEAELPPAAATAMPAGWLADLEAESRRLLQAGEPGVWDTLTRQFEAQLIHTALDLTRGRRIEAAQRLGIGRNTITRKIQELGLPD